MNKDKQEAHALSASNYPDALHVVLAKKAKARFLTTRNMQDFVDFEDEIEIILPECL